MRGDSPLDLAFGEQRPRIDAALVDQLQPVDGVDRGRRSRSPATRRSSTSTASRSATPGTVPLLGMNWVDRRRRSTRTGSRRRSRTDGRRRDRHRPALGRHRRLRRRRPRDGAHDRARHGTFTIVGIAKFGSARLGRVAPRSVLFTDATAQQLLAEPGKVDGVAFTARRRLAATAGRRPRSRWSATGVEVITGAQLTKPKTRRRLHENISSFSTFMLIFAGDRDVRRCVHHQQHVLDHGGATHQGDGDAAGDRCQSGVR